MSSAHATYIIAYANVTKIRGHRNRVQLALHVLRRTFLSHTDANTDRNNSAVRFTLRP
jgi:hypothetical protein